MSNLILEVAKSAFVEKKIMVIAEGCRGCKLHKQKNQKYFFGEEARIETVHGDLLLQILSLTLRL